jgi:hypothetical protein
MALSNFFMMSVDITYNKQLRHWATLAAVVEGGLPVARGATWKTLFCGEIDSICNKEHKAGIR